MSLNSVNGLSEMDFVLPNLSEEQIQRAYILHRFVMHLFYLRDMGLLKKKTFTCDDLLVCSNAFINQEFSITTEQLFQLLDKD